MNKRLLTFSASAAMVLAICGCGTIQENHPMKKPSSITDVHDFLKQTRTYYLATVDGDQPRVRPFGTVMLYDGRLYIQTGRKKMSPDKSPGTAKWNSVLLTAIAGCGFPEHSSTMTGGSRRRRCWKLIPT